MILALAGGVGGAKLALGLARVLDPEELTIAVNTGDDFEHLGLHVSPDLDTVMYTLAGLANPATGWGRVDETWSFMETLAQVGGATWFRLGDRDLATHIERTRRLRAGQSLSEATTALCRALGVRHAIVPATDDPLRTIVHTDEGALEFQDYFVRRQCRPRVQRIAYDGSEMARPSAGLATALAREDLQGVVIAPSNPYLSIAPILSIPGVRQAIARSRRVIAVSPIIGGHAVKGPAAKIMLELGLEPSAFEVARFYSRLAHGLMLDRTDSALSGRIAALGVAPLVDDILMKDDEDRLRLARSCIDALLAS